MLTVGLWHISAMVPNFTGAAPPVDLWQGVAHIAYLIPMTSYSWYQPVYWTLAYEFAFYISIGLAFPLICAAERRFRWFIVVALAIGIVLAGLLSPHILLFVIGIAVFRVTREPSENVLALLIVVGAAAAIAFFDRQIATVGLAAAATMYFCRRVEIGGFLGSSLLWLDSISYSFYLTHVPIGGRVANLGRRWIEGTDQHFALSVFAVVVCIAFAYGFVRLVEQPAIQKARKYRMTPAITGS
jgi:peptidoglycan/LPS O-acetylase OafA/YrhL